MTQPTGITCYEVATLMANPTVTIYGAYGHTGRFVVAEVRRRGWTAILSGRDAFKLRALHATQPDLEVRPASVDDPSSLDNALVGAAAVINCAGPFAMTAVPVIEAALRAGIPYLDIAAEVEVPTATFEQFGARAREAGIAIVPSIAFFGGLSDLLATCAVGDWSSADEISVAFALSSWKPTLGTRATSEVWRESRGDRRRVFSNGRIEFRSGPAPVVEWHFRAPVGIQEVESEFMMADIVTLSSHLRTPEIRMYMTMAPLKDLDSPDLSPPQAIDESGRSAQTFLVEVVARSGREQRRAVASGRDIYAISAPLVVEATQRVIAGQASRSGVVAAGEAFDARDFLESLAPDHLSLAID